MNEMDEARAQIEAIDKEMASLFEKRMQCSKAVSEYKKSHGLPVLDKNREKILLERNVGYLSNPEIEPYYREFFAGLLDVSKKYQHKLISGVRVAYSGIEGSFAAISCEKIIPDAHKISCKNFKEAYEMVERGDCELCVLPIENSYAGEVGQVTDLMLNGSLYINGVYELSVSQCLLGVKGSSLDTITTVVSHPQALEQCNEFIFEHHYNTVQSDNTARAAKEIADNGDIHVGAIASKETSELYGLTILDHDINKSDQNTTRFAVFSKSKNQMKVNSDFNAFILMFTVKNDAGSLAKAVSTIGAYGYNMRVIKSRPNKDKNWTYYFYTEIEGKINTDNGAEMLKALSVVCESVKVIGTYKPETRI